MTNSILFVLFSLFSFGQTEELTYSEMSGLERYEFDEQNDRRQCADLAIGKTKWIKGPSPLDSATKRAQPNYIWNPMSYFLSRPDANTYRVVFPVKFEPGPDYDGGDIPAGLDEKARKRFVDTKYRERINKCLPELNAKMPVIDGKKIQIGIDSTADVADNRTGNQAEVILIGSKDRRSNGAYYESDISCAVIIHELLHNAGLPDTYYETNDVLGYLYDQKGNRLTSLGQQSAKEFDCRPIPPKQTIMDDSGFWEKGAKLYQSAVACVCENEPCDPGAEVRKSYPKGIVRSNPSFKCPAGYKEVLQTHENVYQEQLVDHTKTDLSHMILVMKNAQPPPMLAPAQARHIMYPNCQEKNRRFYFCSSNSYTSTTYKGCGLSTNECSNDPKWMD